MQAFDYIALDQAGKRQTGTLMAATAREGRDMLRTRALMPVELAPSRQRKSKTEDRFSGGRLGRVKHKDLTQATRQMAVLINAATPVEDALRVSASQFERSSMQGVLLSVRAQVMEGLRLSDALRSQPKVFDPLYVAMVASGETAGRLGAVLERLADDLEAARAIRGKIMAATVYPVLLSLFAIIVVIALMIFLVPQVVEQFTAFGQDLPVLTRFIIGLSEGVKSYGLYVLGAIIFVYIALRFALTRPPFRYKWDGMKLRLPMLGKLMRDINAARFSRTMAGLISAGTPALTAMETARHTLRNVVMREGVSGAIERVRGGAPISTALRETELFPLLVTQMVYGGEASGDAGKMFGKAADYLEDDFNRNSDVFLSLLGPMIIVLLGGVVLMIVIAIFLPILQLNKLAF